MAYLSLLWLDFGYFILILWAFVGLVHTLHISIRFNTIQNRWRSLRAVCRQPVRLPGPNPHSDAEQATTCNDSVSACFCHMSWQWKDKSRLRIGEMLWDSAILGGHLKSSATFWSPMVKGTCFLSMKYKHNLERHQHQVLKDLPFRMMVLPLLAFDHVF